MFACKMFKIIILGVICCGMIDTHPSSGWWNFPNRIYFYDSELQTDFFGAQEYCKSRHGGMKVLTLDSDDDAGRLLEAIQSLTGSRGVSFWTSGQKHQDSDQWTWTSNGHPITFFHWGSTEPNNKNSDQICLQVRVNHYREGWWGDENCQAKTGVICQLDV